MLLVRCPRHAVESGSHKTLFRFPLHNLTFCLVVSTSYGYCNRNAYISRKGRRLKCDIGCTGFEPVTLWLKDTKVISLSVKRSNS